MNPDCLPPAGTRLVLFREDIADLLVGRDEQGNRLTFEWGEPDEHGWYSPTVKVDYDDNLLDRAAPITQRDGSP